MSDIYKEFGVDVLRDCCSENEGPTAAEMKMAREIERLRARVAELDDVLMHTLVSLVAAIDLLKAGGKAAAPSNKMFDQMIKDYEKAVSNARKQLAAKS
jgi:hypothetical protein